MAETPLSKEDKQWNKQLGQLLEQYAALRDWSELAAWLNKLKNHIGQRKGVVLETQTLLKRLASSLNPTLPVALHEATLQIYELLFASGVIGGDALHTTCIGLFSFYTLANVKNKTKINEILIKHLPSYGSDVRVLITGLAVTILPSLNQMYEGLQRGVNGLLDLMARPDLVGQQMLAEALWVAVLRSPSCRVAGLKFISSKLGKGLHEEENDDEDTFWNESPSKKSEESKSNEQKSEECSPKLEKLEVKTESKDLVAEWCPNVQKLVMNALIICIEDSNVLAIKSGLDFLYKYIPLKSESISDQAKLRMARSVVWLLGKRDTSVTRKINLWLFGKPDDENRYAVNQKQLYFVIESLVGFLRKETSLQPLKIAFNLLTEHDEMPGLVLREIVPDLLDFCQKQESNSEGQKEALKQMNRLIERIKDHSTIFLSSLSGGLRKAIEAKQYEAATHTLDHLVFFLNKVLKPEQVEETLRPTLSILLETSVRTRWQESGFMKQNLKQILEIIEKNKEHFKKVKLFAEEEELLRQHNDLFAELVELVREKEQEQSFEEEIALMNKLLVRAEEIFGVSGKEWVTHLLSNIALTTPQHFISPIEVLGQAMERNGVVRQEIQRRAEDESKNNCIRVCMAKLWGILSLGHLQTRVIPLLLRLVKHFTSFFERLLEGEFEGGELAIIKFRLFWEVAPKYPHIMGSEQVEEVTRYGLFRMLKFLDSSNPLVKYHSNIWANDTYPNFNRVLNPIMEIMLKPKQCWYCTPQGQYVYAVTPEVSKISTILGHLKSFIRLVPQKFSKFAFKPLTPKIMPYYHIFRGDDPSVEGVEVPYIAVLLELIMRYAESKFVGGDNFGVDLAACEVMEVIVRTASSPQVSNFLLKHHFKSFLRALHFATANQEHLLQIQLLELLRQMMIDSSVRRMGDPKILREAVGSGRLVDTLLEGVKSDFPYIKQRFVEFLNECIPLLLEYHPACAEAISRVFNTYITKIAYVNSKKVEASSQKDLQISQKNAEILILFQGIKQLLSHFLNLNPKPFEKERFQHDTEAGLFSFYSLKAYVNLKLQRKQTNTRHRKLHEEIGRQLTAELPSLVAIMAACWTISQLRPHYAITLQGATTFDYEVFLSYNVALTKSRDRLETEESVEGFIVGLLRVLLNTHPGQTMTALVGCWSGSVKDMDTRLRVLELLTFSGVPMEQFFGMVSEAVNPAHVMKRKRGGGLELERNGEQDVLFLCHCFSHYSYQNSNYLHSNHLTHVWLAFCKAIKMFDATRNPLTLLALLELIHLFVVKYNPKQIIREEKIKRQLVPLLAFHQDMVALLNGKLKIQAQGTWYLRSMFPLPATLNQMRQSEGCPEYLLVEEVPAQRSAEMVRLLGLAVARRISYTILTTLSGGENEMVVIRRVKEMGVGVLGLVEEKDGSRWVVEAASELILGLLEQRKNLLVKELKNEILHIFNKEDFFICSSRTLVTWARIIDLIIDSNKDHDVFQEYLEKVSLAPSLFSSISFETKKKIKSFERICFILYAGKKDKYTQKAQLLVDKLIEVIKNSDAPTPVLILVFFCIRILILRMSAEKLTKLMATLWGMVIFLLSNIFSETPHRDRLNLHWAALKLVEMISLMQIAEFHPHQWTFFYDLVGLQFNSEPNPAHEIQLSIPPKIQKFLPPDVKVVKEEDWPEVKEGHLIIKEDKIDDIELLKTKALALSNYLVASNGCRFRFDMREVEELINSDFLNLDEFIYKVK